MTSPPRESGDEEDHPGGRITVGATVITLGTVLIGRAVYGAALPWIFCAAAGAGVFFIGAVCEVLGPLLGALGEPRTFKRAIVGVGAGLVFVGIAGGVIAVLSALDHAEGVMVAWTVGALLLALPIYGLTVMAREQGFWSGTWIEASPAEVGGVARVRLRVHTQRRVWLLRASLSLVSEKRVLKDVLFRSNDWDYEPAIVTTLASVALAELPEGDQEIVLQIPETAEPSSNDREVRIDHTCVFEAHCRGRRPFWLTRPIVLLESAAAGPRLFEAFRRGGG